VQSNCNDISRWSPLSSLHCYIWPAREVIAHCQKLLGIALVRGWLCCFTSDDVRTCFALRSSGSSAGTSHCLKMHVGNFISLLIWSFSSRFCRDGLPEKARVFETQCASIPDLKLWMSHYIVALRKNSLQHVMTCLAKSSGRVQWWQWLWWRSPVKCHFQILIVTVNFHGVKIVCTYLIINLHLSLH
jgi:hypothetical protein